MGGREGGREGEVRVLGMIFRIMDFGIQAPDWGI